MTPSYAPEEVEEALVRLVQTARHQFPWGGDSPTLTLIGFDLHIEFLIFSHNYPRFLRCFDSWVDVQDLAKDLAAMSPVPSLQNTLIAFGYVRRCPAIALNSKRHNAGNDALRTICALVILLYYQPQGVDLIRVCDEYHSNRAKQRRNEQRKRMQMNRNDFFRRRYPSPREKYPFQAKVDLPESALQAPPDPETLCEYFLGFKPVAAGGNPKNTFGGWICLASLDELNAFLEEVHGLEDTEGRGKWVARSQYDPTVVSATTKAELEEHWRQKSMVEIAEKQRIRQERKLRQAEGSCRVPS